VANRHDPEPELSRGSVPVPDPTVLTTKLTARDIAALRELLDAKIDAVMRTLETRLNAMDEAHRLLQAMADRVPSRIDEKVDAIEKLLDEKIEAVHQRLTGAITNAETRVAEGNKAILLTREEHQRTLTHIEKIADAQPGLMTEKITAAMAIISERFKAVEQQFTERDARTDFAFAAAKEIVTNQNAASALAVAKSEAAFSKQIDQQHTLMNATTNAMDSKINETRDRLTRLEGAGLGRQQQYGQWIAGAGILIAAAVLLARFTA